MENIIRTNMVYNEDVEDMLEKVESESVDLCVIDPPYFRILKNEDWDKFKNIEEYLEWSNRYLSVLLRKIRLNGTVLLYGCTRNFNILAELNNIFIENGMEFIQEIVIDKGIKSVAGRTNPNIKMLPPVTENIMVYRKDAKPFVKKVLKENQLRVGKSAKEMNLILGCRSNGGGNWTKYTGNTEFPLFPTEEHWNTLNNYFNIGIDYKNIKVTYNPMLGLTNVWSDINFYIRDRKHPSEKPVQLSERIIRLFSDENDVVLIPFAGSGSEIEACISNSRKWIASEKNEMYYQEAILPRIEKVSV